MTHYQARQKNYKDIFKHLLEVHRYPHFLRRIWWRYVSVNLVRLTGAQIAARICFHGAPIVTLHKNSEIIIGEDCVLCSRSDMTDLGVNHPVVLRTLRTGAIIVIGNYTRISGGAICAALRVEIGRKCLIGANVTISDTDFHSLKPDDRIFNHDPHDIPALPVIIEDNVFIGTGAIILKGVRIGRNSVIGAGAVVTKSIPQNSIAAGNPAKVIRNMLACTQ